MLLTKRLCRRYHSLQHWRLTANKNQKIPFRKYIAVFHCVECHRDRIVEYPYCPICQNYVIESHDHEITDDVVIKEGQ